jgi:hypothetical protein
MSNDEQPRDHVAQDDGVARDDSNDLEQNVKSRSTWLRLVFMIIFFALYALSRFVVFAVVILQFLWVLFTAETNEKLVKLGQSLATYTYQIVIYLTFNSDSKPFPFDRDWPASAPEPD